MRWGVPAKVDVAMATYNHAAYIRQAMDSVIAQQTDFHVRLVVGDDCSTDGTQEIIREYAERYPGRVEAVLSSEHAGFPSARSVVRRIFQRCTAPFLALLDGDDYWTDPSKLARQVAILHKNPEVALVFHPAVVRDEHGGREQPQLLGPLQIKDRYTLDDLIEQIAVIPTNSVLYRNLHSGRFPDWVWTVPLLDFALHALHALHGPAAYLREPLSAYRVHGGAFWAVRAREARIRDSIGVYRTLGRKLQLTDRPAYGHTLARMHLTLASDLRGLGRRRAAAWATAVAGYIDPSLLRGPVLEGLIACLPWTPHSGFGRLLFRKPPV